MAKYKDNKFIVINKKIADNIPKEDMVAFDEALDALELAIVFNGGELLDNKYYICNQDEPYAKKSNRYNY